MKLLNLFALSGLVMLMLSTSGYAGGEVVYRAKDPFRSSVLLAAKNEPQDFRITQVRPIRALSGVTLGEKRNCEDGEAEIDCTVIKKRHFVDAIAVTVHYATKDIDHGDVDEEDWDITPTMEFRIPVDQLSEEALASIKETKGFLTRYANKNNKMLANDLFQVELERERVRVQKYRLENTSAYDYETGEYEDDDAVVRVPYSVEYQRVRLAQK